jgi:hypothetical protein
LVEVVWLEETIMNRSCLAGIVAILAFSTSANANLIGVDEIEIQSAVALQIQVSEVIATESGTGIDVALASNGGVATAFSTLTGCGLGGCGLASPAFAIDGIYPADFPNIYHSSGAGPMSFWT